MQKKQSAAEKDEKDPILWAAGNYMTPHRLAMQQMRAVTALGVGVMAAGLGAWYAMQSDELWPAVLGVTAWVLTYSYARSLLRHLRRVESTLWHQEELAGTDMDGDGFVGRPPEPKKIKINQVEDDFGAEWNGQEVTVEETGQGPEFVRRFILRAGEIGLTRSAWVPTSGERQTIAGQKVSRDSWETMTAWLIGHGWAENNGKGLRLTRQPGWILRQLDRAEAEAAGAGRAAGGREPSVANHAPAPAQAGGR